MRSSKGVHVPRLLLHMKECDPEVKKPGIGKLKPPYWGVPDVLV